MDPVVVDRARGAPRAGAGHLRFARVDGASALAGCTASSPLQVLAPRRRGPSAWAVLASHGGGLVAGDRIELTIDVADGARALLSTQAQTKVYRCPGASMATQLVHARVAQGAVLAMVPDAISMFGGARYEQRQRFELEPSAGLLLVDSVVAGRTARGERWAFDRYRACTEVRVGGRLVFGDALLLERGGALALADRLAPFQTFGFVLALGAPLSAHLGALAALAGDLPVVSGAPLLATSSAIPGGVLLRFAARHLEPAAELVHSALTCTADAIGVLPRRW